MVGCTGFERDFVHYNGKFQWAIGLKKASDLFLNLHILDPLSIMKTIKKKS